MVKEQFKKIWESKTFWMNTLLIVGGVCTTIAGELEAGAIITLPAIINIVLRFVTKTGVKV